MNTDYVLHKPQVGDVYELEGKEYKVTNICGSVKLGMKEICVSVEFDRYWILPLEFVNRYFTYKKPILKPCPFCSGEGKHITVNLKPTIECKRCGARGPESSTDLCPHSQEEAEELWNTRFVAKTL